MRLSVESRRKGEESHLEQMVKSSRRRAVRKRIVAVLAAFIVAAAVLTALFNMLIPELIKSIGDLFKALPGQVEEFIDYVGKLQEGDQPINKFLENLLRQGSETLENWAKTDLLKQTNVLMTSAAVGVINVINLNISNFQQMIFMLSYSYGFRRKNT